MPDAPTAEPTAPGILLSSFPSFSLSLFLFLFLTPANCSLEANISEHQLSDSEIQRRQTIVTALKDKQLEVCTFKKSKRMKREGSNVERKDNNRRELMRGVERDSLFW